MEGPNDSQIGWQTRTGNHGQSSTVTADEGCDSADLRDELRAHDIR